MREIWVSDYANHLRPCAALELGAHTLFPEDVPSLQQALKLIEMEHERWVADGPDSFEFSGLVMKILTGSQRGAGQRLIVGLVGIAMYCLNNAGKKVTLEAAAEIVSEYANSISSQTFRFLKKKKWIERELALTGDFKDIQKIFRKYRSVAHICAAEATSADYLEPRNGFEPQPVADGCFVSTAMFFQNVFRNVENFDDWNLWEIRFSPPNPDDLVVLLPTEQAVENIMMPWLTSMSTAMRRGDN